MAEDVYKIPFQVTQRRFKKSHHIDGRQINARSPTKENE